MVAERASARVSKSVAQAVLTIDAAEIKTDEKAEMNRKNATRWFDDHTRMATFRWPLF